MTGYTMLALHVGYTELLQRLAPDEFGAAIEKLYGHDLELTLIQGGGVREPGL